MRFGVSVNGVTVIRQRASSPTAKSTFPSSVIEVQAEIVEIVDGMVLRLIVSCIRRDTAVGSKHIMFVTSAIISYTTCSGTGFSARIRIPNRRSTSAQLNWKIRNTELLFLTMFTSSMSSTSRSASGAVFR